MIRADAEQRVKGGAVMIFAKVQAGKSANAASAEPNVRLEWNHHARQAKKSIWVKRPVIERRSVNDRSAGNPANENTRVLQRRVCRHQRSTAP